MMETCLFDGCQALSSASEYTIKKLKVIRERLDNELQNSAYAKYITVIATGSYGRGEASDESDLDLYIIFNKDESAEDEIREELAAIDKVISEEVPNSAGDSGTFGSQAIISLSEMQKNIGGQDDTNESLTRRMLFLLEGTWLFGKNNFNSYQKKLLLKYIKASDSSNKTSKFLLNDIIRYYRTIATDFEFKTSERNKEWGLRSIKLRFSRKLLYFGGVIVVAETSDLCHSDKLKRSIELFSLPILERIRVLSDTDAVKKESSELFEIYESFIEKISDPTVRKKLTNVSKAERDENEEFSELRTLGELFSNKLSVWLNVKYKKDHPIHHSLVF